MSRNSSLRKALNTEMERSMRKFDSSVDKPLAETRAALRKEIGEPTERDHLWMPMISAGEVRQLLDALDAADESVTNLGRCDLCGTSFPCSAHPGSPS